MKIDLRKLYGLKELSINEEYLVSEDTYTKMGVRKMGPVLVKGVAKINYDNNIEIDLNLEGNFIMPCSITFEDVIVPFKTKIEEEIVENTLNDDFFLDLSDVLWENIVLEIPFNVVKEGAKINCLHGDGWELKEED